MLAPNKSARYCHPCRKELKRDTANLYYRNYRKKKRAERAMINNVPLMGREN